VWVRKSEPQSSSDPSLLAHLVHSLFSRSEIICHSLGTRDLNSSSSTISSFSSLVAALERRKSDRVMMASLYCSKPFNSKELIIRYRPFFSDFLYQLPCLRHVPSQTSGETLIILLISSRPGQTTALPDLSPIFRLLSSDLRSFSFSFVNQYICFMYLSGGLIVNRPFQFCNIYLYYVSLEQT